MGSHFLALFRLGDFLTLILMALGTVGLALAFWDFSSSQAPTQALIRSGSHIIANIKLPAYQQITVNGPLGETVISIEGYRAKVLTDPSPRQYCVSRGWLDRAGDIDICLPNRISLQLQGSAPLYDSIHY